jgi:molybdopterin converting factor small subunit
MAKVKIKYFSRLRELLDIREEEYEVKNSSLADLLIKYIPTEITKELKEINFVTLEGGIVINKDGALISAKYFILVNGLNRDLTYILKDGDEVVILPPIESGNCEDQDI